MALFGARPEAPRLGGKAAALARERNRDRDSGQETERLVLAALREVQAETMTPLEALQTLDRLSSRLRTGGGAVIDSSPEADASEDLDTAASPATSPTILRVDSTRSSAIRPWVSTRSPSMFGPSTQLRATSRWLTVAGKS